MRTWFQRFMTISCSGSGFARARALHVHGWLLILGSVLAKTLSHNLTLLANLHRFHDLDVPLLLGASRKRFIGSLSGEEDPQQRAAGSIAAALAGVSRGVQILRIHDVEQTHQALAVWRAIEKAGSLRGRHASALLASNAIAGRCNI